MLSLVQIRDDLTMASYGYTTADLRPGSHAFVIVECTVCQALVRKEFRNAGKKHSCPTVIGTNKHCYGCGQWKDLTLFNKNGKLKGGVSKLCRECYNNHDAVKKYEYRRCLRLRGAARENDYRFYINRRGTRMIGGWRADGVPYNITVADLIGLWEQQTGLCYYSGVPMVGIGTDKGLASWNSPSLDRLTPSLGYITGNVVWCLNCINSFKGQLNEVHFEQVVKSITWRWNT